MLHTTSGCRAFGHPEFTLQQNEQFLPSLALHRTLIGYFENAVARGTKFLPGQTVRFGWKTLRLVARRDGTIGVEERTPAPRETWSESVDGALRELWLQKEVLASVGLSLADADVPSEDMAMMAHQCALDAQNVLMMRLATEGAPPTFSGWTVECTDSDHDHGEAEIVPLIALSSLLPGLVQFLALPRGAAVLALYEPQPGSDAMRISPHIFLNGEEATPKPGSYLEMLQR